MLEPFPKISGAADAAAVKLRRTGFNVRLSGVAAAEGLDHPAGDRVGSG